MYRYKLGLYEKAMPDDMPLEEKLLGAKETGYDHMELCVDLDPERQKRLDWTKEERAYWRNFMYENDIPVTTFSLSALRGCPLGELDVEKNQQAFDMIEKGAKLACDLGSRVMLINGYDVYDTPSTPQTTAQFYKNLEKAVAICEKYGILLSIENAEREFCDSIKKAARHVRHITSPYVGIYADCGNSANYTGGDTDAVIYDITCGQGMISAMHLKDTTPGEYRFTPYGQGHVDFGRIVPILKKLGIRIFTAELFYRPEVEWKAEAVRVGKFLRDFF